MRAGSVAATTVCAVALFACSDSEGTTCPIGTTPIGDMCIVRPPPGQPRDGAAPPSPDASPPVPPPGDATMPPDDADATADADAATDAGDASTPADTSVPRDTGTPPSTGLCTSPAACEPWARALFDAIDAYRDDTSGCRARLVWDDRLAGVAADDAQSMAANDSLMGGLPDLLRSVQMAGIDPASMAAFGGTTSSTATAPFERWRTNADVASRLASCQYDLAGAGYATNDAGDESYARLILVER